MPQEELSDLQRQVLELKRQRNALILAHNYQRYEVQQIADFVGDSLQLARKSAEVSGFDMIVFAGVKFMAEMTAILAEGTPVYIPSREALCPLAGWIGPAKVRAAKERHPGAPVVVYVNTTAATKAECDAICTSSNAVEVVESLGAETVLFGPDKNLAEYVRRQTGVKVIDIEPLGHCYVHQQFKLEHIERMRALHPDAIVIAHPECPPEVQGAADIIGSTGKMVKIVAEPPEKKFIIATEVGLVEQLQHAHPDKVILPAYEGAVCRQMKKTTLEGILRVLRDLPPENLVTVPDEVKDRVREVINAMNALHSAAESAVVAAGK